MQAGCHHGPRDGAQDTVRLVLGTGGPPHRVQAQSTQGACVCVHTHTHTHTQARTHTDTHRDAHTETQTPHRAKSLAGGRGQLPAAILNLQSGRVLTETPELNRPRGVGPVCPGAHGRPTGTQSCRRPTAPPFHQTGTREARPEALARFSAPAGHRVPGPGGSGLGGDGRAGTGIAQSPRPVLGQASAFSAVLSGRSTGRSGTTGQVPEGGPAEQEGIPRVRCSRALLGGHVGDVQRGERLGRWGARC